MRKKNDLDMGAFLGKPFFVTKERFPQTPSKKVALDFTQRHKIILGASETINKKSTGRNPLIHRDQ